MRYVIRIQKIPTAEPLPGISVRVRKQSDGSTITTLVSDADGWVVWQADGHPEPFYFHVEGQPGGDKYWRSDEVHGAGAISLAEIPHALRAMGDGIIRGYSSELAVSLVSGGPSVSVAPGAANVVGHPFVYYTAALLANSRPVSGTRIDRVVIRLNPEGSATTPGKAVLALLAGTVDAGVPALTQTADLHEISLAKITVPHAGAITLTDERLFSGEKPPVSGVVRVASVSTASTTGEALAGLSIILDPLRSGTNVIEAHVSCIHTPATVWELQNTYGQLGSGNDDFNTPGQVGASDFQNLVHVADTANNRAVHRFLSTGAFVGTLTGLTGITGVAMTTGGFAGDGGFCYAFGTSLRQYANTFATIWTVTPGGTLKHVATDNSHVYVTDQTNHKVWKLLITNGSTVASWGTLGAGNANYSAPWGIGVRGGEVYVVDAGNSRVKVTDLVGTFVRSFPISAGARGIAFDAAGNVLVADYANNLVKRYSNVGILIDQFSQVSPDGIAIADGDIAWVTNAVTDNLTKWDQALSGYGSIAIEIDGVVGDYTAVGERVMTITDAATGSKAGPGTCIVRVFGKTTENTANFGSCVLSAKSTPQR